MSSRLDQSCHRLRIVVRGAVQGVGFRPFVYRLATEMGLHGQVENSSRGVFIEVEGPLPALRDFLGRLPAEKPSLSFIQSMEPTFLDPVGYPDFQVSESDTAGPITALVMPDIATCPDCLAEIRAPANRRYRYPFTNCTNCGPRFTIIRALPYDRATTSMSAFTMCPACQAEYENPADRRFHAQPNACPVCGPQVALWNPAGQTIATGDEALVAAVQAIRDGAIVAVKGIGGFHLMVDARSEPAVRRLRERKRRHEKPLALMYPNLGMACSDCVVSPLEQRTLLSPEAPIVLLVRRPEADLAQGLAPGNPNLGVILPYSPLHHLLLDALEFPVVATSGNLSDEPICTDEHEALRRLAGIADFFLVHNRPIVRHVDDSIVRIVLEREAMLRRARGYAPLPITVTADMPCALAVGAHLKNAVAIGIGHDVFVSQHIGDLETAEAYSAFRDVIRSLSDLYNWKPAMVACDLHPDYLSSRFAGTLHIPIFGVQHHLAHVLSCATENDLAPNYLGVAWDGTGYGPDGVTWGSEFFRVTAEKAERVAHFSAFPLCGGDRAVKEPRRSALGVLYAALGPEIFDRQDLAPLQAFASQELSVLRQMLTRRVNCPLTTSAGRLFDAASSLAGLQQRTAFEGQAAMDLEFSAVGQVDTGVYPFEIRDGDRPWNIVWGPLIQAFMQDLTAGASVGVASARFHNSLAEIIVSVARLAGENAVVLSGGCFQNRRLTEQTVRRLQEEGFRPYWHQRLSPNDGGIALGQVVAAAGQIQVVQ